MGVGQPTSYLKGGVIMADNQKERMMKALNISSEEADELLAYDKRIDKGERCEFDLDLEKEKEAKKMANSSTRKAIKTTRTRAENPTKQTIISQIADFLSKIDEITCENVEIINKERQIGFKVGENSYEITLTQKRKPKK